MIELDAHPLGLLIATVVYMAIGALWYSPILFGNAWTKLVGKSMKDMGDPGKGFVVTGVMALVMAIVLSQFLSYAGAASWSEGLLVGLLAGVGFVATGMSGVFVFEKRPLSLYLINVGYQVVGLMAMGVVLSMWR